MCNPKINTNAISMVLTENWVVSAIGQMNHLHSEGLCLDVAAKLVVGVCCAVAASVQATADASQNKEFDRDMVRKLIENVLSQTPMPFQELGGHAAPVTLN